MYKILDKINTPDDIKKLDLKQLESLAEEIRTFLVENVSCTGGHLASNLGIVEVTLMLHKVFKTPNDRIIWDVGHQSYVHKMITGRKDKFSTLRKMNGISGFPKVNESIHDCFDTGHSSTSISVGLGLARARDISGEDYSVISLIGDGSMTGGMSFEALNDAGRSPNNLIVLLNDNQMSISKNVGGLSRYLSRIRVKPIYSKFKWKTKAILNKIPIVGNIIMKLVDLIKDAIKYLVMPGIIFEEMGFKYLGPIDGHSMVELEQVFINAKKIKGPVLIHVCTQKGKGYTYAEENPHDFHGISPFKVETGEVIVDNGPGYSDIFGEALVKLAKTDPKIVAITAAMPLSTGLGEFSSLYKDRFFDVGIAEQHAVTMAAGMARNGYKPVFAVYSTFLQRAYDQILHDVAIQNLHVVLAVDRAGLVGEDGETHQGVFDYSFLRTIPNLTIMAPCDYNELSMMLEFALQKQNGPIAIRYPRGRGVKMLVASTPIMMGKGLKIKEGSQLTIVAIGKMVETAIVVGNALMEKGIDAEIIHARFLKPLDESLLIESVKRTRKIVTLEDNIAIGGLGSSVSEMLCKNEITCKMKAFGFPDQFIEHGNIKELQKKYHLDAESMIEELMNF